MRKICITQRLAEVTEYNEIRNSLDIRWQELLLSIDFIPIPLPLNVELHLHKDLEISGIILTGGNDLFSQSQNELSILRDKHEKQCIKYAIEKSIPILGICRGMELIAEYFGSTLKIIENHIAKHHKICSTTEHEYHKQFNNIEYVNSYHKYAIDILGNDLEAVAICPEDNVIEAIRHKSYKIFGQMWHPERDNPFDLNNCHIISSFFS